MIKKNSSHFTLEDIVFNTIHHSEISPDEIAANTGTGYNHLMRMANPTDACNMPLHKAVPIMNVTKDFTLLHYMARQTGHLAIPMPRGIRKGTNPKMDVHEYSKEFHEMITLVFDYLKEPSQEKLDEFDERMRKHIGDSENIRRRAASGKLEQGEFEL